jgi:hypothetical protein
MLYPQAQEFPAHDLLQPKSEKGMLKLFLEGRIGKGLKWICMRRRKKGEAALKSVTRGDPRNLR